MLIKCFFYLAIAVHINVMSQKPQNSNIQYLPITYTVYMYILYCTNSATCMFHDITCSFMKVQIKMTNDQNVI